MEQLKVSIVEDDLNYQKWILEALKASSFIECVSKHSLGEEALAEIPYYRPDLVLMDLSLEKSKYDGIECILRLRVNWPNLKFIILSAHDDEYRIFEALRVGAGAYLYKEEVDPDSLIVAIKEFHDGGAPMSPGIAKRIIKNLQQPMADLRRLQTLTSREKSVLELLSRGKLYKEVANVLGIREGTVKQHAHNIYKKLQVFNAVEAMLKYFNLR